jgi:hypothetical protein
MSIYLNFKDVVGDEKRTSLFWKKLKFLSQKKFYDWWQEIEEMVQAGDLVWML